jgi:inosose dehydratase
MVVTRRDVLQGLIAVGLPMSSVCSGRAGAAPGRGEAFVRFGAQTNAWPIDPHHFASLLDVLRQMRSVGYAGFETGFANIIDQFSSPSEARRQIAETGLEFFGIHIYLPSQQYDPVTRIAPASLYERVMHGGAALGAKHVIFSSIPTRHPDEIKHKASALDSAGMFANKLGLRIAYHNEKNDEGEKELEALLAATDANYVPFLLDAGHAYLSGMDVPAFLHKHSGRIIGIHLRDFRDGNQVPLGQGTFPLAATAAALKQVHWHGWVLNEEERTDGTKAGLRFIRPAFEQTRKAFES